MANLCERYQDQRSMSSKQSLLGNQVIGTKIEIKDNFHSIIILRSTIKLRAPISSKSLRRLRIRKSWTQYTLRERKTDFVSSDLMVSSQLKDTVRTPFKFTF